MVLACTVFLFPIASPGAPLSLSPTPALAECTDVLLDFG